MEDCIFCQIAEGKSPATVEAETDNVIAFRSINPVSSTHVLITPKRHIGTFTDISVDDAEVVFEMTQVIKKLVKQLEIKSGYKVVVNGGSYQVVPHLHWHLLGGNLDGKDVINKT